MQPGVSGWPTMTPGAYAGPFYPAQPDNSGKASASLVLGIIGLVCALCPYVGLPLGIIGLVMGILGRKSRASGTATAGIVLSIITIVLSLAVWSFGVYLIATGRSRHFGRFNWQV